MAMMLSIHSARRPRERGATLFVVVLAITMLTGVGLYTVHSASLSARAAGNGREALQAERVAELGGLALLSQVRIEGRPYVQDAVNADPGFCEMNGSLPPGTSCLQVLSDDLHPPSGAGLIGNDSFGSLATLSGKARLEITDVNETKIPIAGHDVNDEDLKFYQATVTSIGTLYPVAVAGNTCIEGMMQVAGQHLLRAHLLLGPMPKVQKKARENP
jgi:hypothetical protein